MTFSYFIHENKRTNLIFIVAAPPLQFFSIRHQWAVNTHQFNNLSNNKTPSYQNASTNQSISTDPKPKNHNRPSE